MASASATPLAHTYLEASQPARLDTANGFGVAAVMARGVPRPSPPPWVSCAKEAGPPPHPCMAGVANRNTPAVHALPRALPVQSCPAGLGYTFAPRVIIQGRRGTWDSSVSLAPPPAPRRVAARALGRVHAEPYASPQRQRTSPSGADKEPCIKPSTEALHLLHLPKPQGGADGEYRVRLTLTVSCGGVGCTPPGSTASDCGFCQFCMDKPKFGGPGSKRKRCVARRCLQPGPARVWGSLRVVTAQYLQQLEEYASQDPPPELVEARAKGPIALVWGFRRAPRARPIPPAYVLMYHCERHVQLDRSTLPVSLLEQWYGRGGRQGLRGRDTEGGLVRNGGRRGRAGGALGARRPPDCGWGDRCADAAGASGSAEECVATGLSRSGGDGEADDAGEERVEWATEGKAGVVAWGEAGARDNEQTSESEAGSEAEYDGAMDLEGGGDATACPSTETELQASGARTPVCRLAPGLAATLSAVNGSLTHTARRRAGWALLCGTDRGEGGRRERGESPAACSACPGHSRSAPSPPSRRITRIGRRWRH